MLSSIFVTPVYVDTHTNATVISIVPMLFGSLYANMAGNEQKVERKEGGGVEGETVRERDNFSLSEKSKEQHTPILCTFFLLVCACLCKCVCVEGRGLLLSCV